MPISNFIITRLLKSARNLEEYDEDDIDVARYGMQAVFWEVEKNLYFFIIFLVLGYPLEWFFSLGVVATVRFFAGGAHVKSVWGCFFLTLSSFLAPILLLPRLIPTTGITVLVVGLFSIVMLIIMAPLIPEARKKLVDSSKNGSKKVIAVVITCLWLLIIFSFQQRGFASIALWTIFLQNLQLFAVFVRQFTGDKN